MEQILREAEEQLTRKIYLQAQGYDLGRIAARVAELLSCSSGEAWSKGKYKSRVKARSILS